MSSDEVKIAEGEEGHPRFFIDVSDPLEQLDNVLEYLRDDGFVTRTNNPIIYHITHQGLVFEGYVEKVRQDNATQKRIKGVERNTLLLSFLIAVGTLVAGWYYLTELCNYYHWTCFFCK